MIRFLGGHPLAMAAAVALGGLGAVGAPEPAHAAAFSADYTCSVPLLGTRTVTVEGNLVVSPNRPVARRLVRVDLYVSRMSLRSPVAVDSWTATADIDVSGAQTTAFRVRGSGGPAPAYQPVTGALSGIWRPTVGGIDRLRVGKVVVTIRTSSFGNVTVSCEPNEPRPVAETLTVLIPRRTGPVL